jgi:hypothetical protein
MGQFKALDLGLRGIWTGQPDSSPALMPLRSAHQHLPQSGPALLCCPVRHRAHSSECCSQWDTRPEHSLDIRASSPICHRWQGTREAKRASLPCPYHHSADKVYKEGQLSCAHTLRASSPTTSVSRASSTILLGWDIGPPLLSAAAGDRQYKLSCLLYMARGEGGRAFLPCKCFHMADKSWAQLFHAHALGAGSPPSPAIRVSTTVLARCDVGPAHPSAAAGERQGQLSSYHDPVGASSPACCRWWGQKRGVEISPSLMPSHRMAGHTLRASLPAMSIFCGHHKVQSFFTSCVEWLWNYPIRVVILANLEMKWSLSIYYLFMRDHPFLTVNSFIVS